MIKIDTCKTKFYSQLDEGHFFYWSQDLECVTSIDGGYFYIRDLDLSEMELRDLMAIMSRYDMPMTSLRQFCNPSNEPWLKDPEAYWYLPIFGEG